MNKLITSMLLVSVLSVGCQDRYRYDCQDPVNWNKQRCKPPECKANETCTKYLIEVNNEE